MPKPRHSRRTCTCETCVSACHNAPGMALPSQVVHAIKTGSAHRFMVREWYPDKRTGNTQSRYVITPAVKGYEGKEAPRRHPIIHTICGLGTCTFLQEGGLCEVHGTPLKPRECRIALGCSESPRAEKRHVAELIKIARAWCSPRGIRVVAAWKKAVGMAA